MEKQLSQNNTVVTPTPFRKIQVIINPAAGLDRPILSSLNKAFSPTSTQWDVSITHGKGDAQRLVREAIAAGCDAIGVHGGDGTVMEAACVLQNTGIPLVIFPGGTGNSMAGELGIPIDLSAAIGFVAAGDFDLQRVDLGIANDNPFILRIAIGFEANLVKNADQELKNRFGMFAYAFSALNELRNLAQVHYKIKVDGQPFDADGISCMIANSASVALPGMKISDKVTVDDGLLDLVIFDNANFGALLSVTSTVLTGGDSTQDPTLHHWQGREIIVDCEPLQDVAVDGEFITKLPVSAHVLPGVLQVVVPKRESSH